MRSAMSGQGRTWLTVATLGTAPALLLLVAGQPGAAQAVVDPCKAWEQPAAIETAVQTERLKTFLLSLVGSRPQGAEPAKWDGQYYFTNKSGFSSQPRCSVKSGASPRDHLWFPLGLVVRKLGEAQLQDKFWLVETEYGLKTFIRETDLSTMGREYVYFFADKPADATESDRKYFCPEQAAECGPSRYVAGQYLSPKTLFAVAKKADFARLGYVGSFDVLYQDPPPSACGVVDVGIYSRNLVPAQYGSLNTCASRTKELDGRIKVVRWEDYDQLFNKKIDGAVWRIDGDVLAKIAPEFRVQKLCNEKLESASETEIKLKAAAGLKFLAIAELGGEGAKKYLWSLKSSLDEKVAVHMHGYQIDSELAHAPVAPLYVRYGCRGESSAPQRAREIRVSHPIRGAAGDFIFSVGDKPNGPSDLWTDSEDKSALNNQGYVFLIRGQKDYYALRDKIARKLRGEGKEQIQDFYVKADDRLYRWRTTAFLTHLIIAAVAKAGEELPLEDAADVPGTVALPGGAKTEN